MQAEDLERQHDTEPFFAIEGESERLGKKGKTDKSRPSKPGDQGCKPQVYRQRITLLALQLLEIGQSDSTKAAHQNIIDVISKS